MNLIEEETRRLINRLILTARHATVRIQALDTSNPDDTMKAYDIEEEIFEAKRVLINHLFPKPVFPGVEVLKIMIPLHDGREPEYVEVQRVGKDIILINVSGTIKWKKGDALPPEDPTPLDYLVACYLSKFPWRMSQGRRKIGEWIVEHGLATREELTGWRIERPKLNFRVNNDGTNIVPDGGLTMGRAEDIPGTQILNIMVTLDGPIYFDLYVKTGGKIVAISDSGKMNWREGEPLPYNHVDPVSYFEDLFEVRYPWAKRHGAELVQNFIHKHGLRS